ncbi:hypothetical protein LCM10_01690 [Rossellomorea aquimaris]|uniref:hypothetical protein n=1 Tax=Rossellomorea aquimaris TaxID=189382 RepID=UPI001CD30401|nr:hypothetical protein [Rossellomorea aquimaris]MCA1053682.1 hypothetical protein [Rossellomorea aquimaris]
MGHRTLKYKIVNGPYEFHQIEQLNDQTVVEEISQNESGRLRVRFHHGNTSIIAKRLEEVMGIISIRADRPFSLDYKMDDLDACILPPTISRKEIGDLCKRRGVGISCENGYLHERNWIQLSLMEYHHDILGALSVLKGAIEPKLEIRYS